jgi:O-antigen ligase
MTEVPQQAISFTFSAFLILALVAVFIAFGVPMAPILALGAIVVFAFAFRFTEIFLYLAIFLTPLTGLRLVIPSGGLQFITRAFSDNIDIPIAEGVFLVLLAVWAVKIFLYWRRRNDRQWEPIFPLWQSYAPFLGAHIASAFSPLLPDVSLVLKYAARPVVFCYLAFIALPVNLIRSRRRLVNALWMVAGIGTIAAMNGLVSVFFTPGSFLSAAKPLAMFGLSALGENHNELAEVLVFTAPATLALSRFITIARFRRVLEGLAVFQALICLLTFTRTGWIVLGIEVAVLSLTIWRDAVRRNVRSLLMIGLLMMPLGVAMAVYSVSQEATSSNSTRLMLSGIALDLFKSSPWVGAGAGSFIDRVGSTQVFLIEYGVPLDSHGFLQKIMAETGIVGLLALAFVAFQLGQIAWNGVRDIRETTYYSAYMMIAVGTLGAVAYQIFNTGYWTGKMWLPIGLFLAATQVLKDTRRDNLPL